MRSLLKTFATMMNWILFMLGALAILFLLALLAMSILEHSGTGGLVIAVLGMMAIAAWYVGMIFNLEDKWEE